MMKSVVALILLCSTPALADAAGPLRPAHTYSIVARDPNTGEMGVAVQSHWFSVGTSVTWAEAGVGAVATQSFVRIEYGPEGLGLMKDRVPAAEALERLVRADPGRDVRQVAMIDAAGRASAWTGGKCIPAAGHHVGDGYSVQANLMLDAGVWPAMAAAFESASGDLAARMMAALEAAQAAGGDIRGRQSAAIKIVKAKSSGKPWADTVVNLRIEDAPEPIVELRRLLTLWRAYEHMNAGDLAVEKNDLDAAVAHYGAAEAMVPQMDEFVFWHAATLAQNGRLDAALPLFRRAFILQPGWYLLAPRLPDVGLLPKDAAALGRILAQGPHAK
ncbi:MAG TPA: DUF1028 domain-containing protein [Candidatus Polarisedimenticolia bacterium]|jgi:uncharacterized Ntn-hydrolase superfamily protein